jgi:hypothetical protein
MHDGSAHCLKGVLIVPLGYAGRLPLFQGVLRQLVRDAEVADFLDEQRPSAIEETTYAGTVGVYAALAVYELDATAIRLLIQQPRAMLSAVVRTLFEACGFIH